MTNKSFQFNRADYSWLTLGLALMSAGFFYYSNLGRQFSQQLPNGIATVEEISNLVKIKNQNDLVWVNASQGQDLPEDSLVFAGEFSKARIAFKDGSKLFLMPGSILRVYQSKEGKFELQLKKGKMVKVAPPQLKEASAPPPVVVVVADEVKGEEVIVKKPDEVEMSVPRQLIKGEKAIEIPWQWKIKKLGNIQGEKKMVVEILDPKGQTLSKSSGLDALTLTSVAKDPGLYRWVSRLNNEVIDSGELEVIQLISPLLLHPKNEGIQLQEREVAFEWSYPMNVDHFEFEIKNGQEIKTYKAPGNARRLSLDLADFSQLEWRMRASSQGQLSSWTSFVGFWRPVVPTPEVKINISEVLAKTFQSTYHVDDLPFTFQVKNLPTELVPFVMMIDGEEIKESGEQKVKHTFEAPGIYKIEVFQELKGKLEYVDQHGLEIQLNPLKEAIALPKDIVIKTE